MEDSAQDLLQNAIDIDPEVFKSHHNGLVEEVEDSIDTLASHTVAISQGTSHVTGWLGLC